MGRPPKDPADLTTEAVTARFTIDERKQLEWLTVHLRARSSSEVIRQSVGELFERTRSAGKALRSSKMDEKKPRTPSIELAFDREVVISGIEDMPDGTVRLWSGGRVLEPDRVNVAHTHERANKSPKALSKWPANPKAIQQDPNRAAAAYDCLVAVDTNTRKSDGTSVAVAVMVTQVQLGHPTWSARVAVQTPLELRGVRGAPERIGWFHFIAGIIKSPEYRSGKTFGIVVDSFLGEHDAINRRISPFVGTVMLPERLTFLYASADRDPEVLPNKLLQLCDKIATHIIERCDRAEAPPFTTGAAHDGADLIRVWPVPEELVAKLLPD
jgi:hypothetical protein